MEAQCKGSLADTITLQDILDAKKRIAPYVRKTPLLPFHASWDGDATETKEIFLKLENLHPIGCFKLRGACNAIRLLSPEQLHKGIYTASAGNFAQALSWSARMYDVRCDVIVPDHAPQAKLRPTLELGGHVTKVPFDTWWRVITEHKYEGMAGTFIHPVSDPAVIAGNGTAGLEILDDLPDVDTVIVPYGGGGLSCGIALAIKLQKPKVKVFACEVETAAPVKASFDAGKPVEFDYKASFVDGIGGKSVLDEMWPLVHTMLDGSIVVTLKQVAEALKLMVERSHVVAEGAGAAALAAAAMTGEAGGGKVVCVISGGNIDTNKLVQVLQGDIPESGSH
ncbi:L-threonine ammonia-lyase-like isoform X1 [Littorina saxatilis]|uniref:L-serine deaminase n=1 Tax=Littorina saxatilis TaxID=31220 RepID=A0AAN9BTN6_9CAEN